MITYIWGTPFKLPIFVEIGFINEFDVSEKKRKKKKDKRKKVVT